MQIFQGKICNGQQFEKCSLGKVVHSSHSNKGIALEGQSFVSV